MKGADLVALGCGQVVGRAGSGAILDFLVEEVVALGAVALGAMALGAMAFGGDGGNGSLGEYSGSGDLGGVDHGELVLVEAVLEE